MCGRFALPGDVREIVEWFTAKPRDLDRWTLHNQPRYNICPTQKIVTIRLGGDGREAVAMRWGYMPRWYKSLTDRPLLINARAETIATKPAFRESARECRCLIPAAGFYEWQGTQKPKRPFYIPPADGRVFAFAGIWRRWQGPDGKTVDSCAIVTCPANESLAPIHHRMPVVILPRDYGLWLGEEGTGAAALMRPAPEDFFAPYPVGPAVNSARSEGEALIEPL